MNLSDIRLIVATPCHGDNCDTEYVKSILKLQKLCLQQGIHIEFFIPPGNSDIAHSRNKIVHELLNKANFTHLLFIDSDIGFDADDVIKMIEADVDVICGIYSKKYIDWGAISEAVKANKPVEELKYFTSPYVVKLVDSLDYSNASPDQPVEIEHCGTGMMLIKRNVFEIQKVKTETYLSWDDEIPPNKSLIYNFFCFSITEDGMRVSEDVYFCKQWRKYGGKVYAAPWMKMKHIGKYSFESSLWR